MMEELDLWFFAYCSVLAGGGSTEKARKSAYVAIDDRRRRKDEIDKCQQVDDVVK